MDQHFQPAMHEARKWWSFKLRSISTELNVKTKYICQAYFSFHTAIHSKEVIPCPVLVAWQRKVFIIMEERGKMLPPFTNFIYSWNWVSFIYCCQNDLQWQNEESTQDHPVFCCQTLKRFVQVWNSATLFTQCFCFGKQSCCDIWKFIYYNICWVSYLLVLFR